MVLIGFVWTCDHSVSGKWTFEAWVDQQLSNDLCSELCKY